MHFRLQDCMVLARFFVPNIVCDKDEDHW